MIGRLFSSHKDDNSKTEIVLSITPRIVGSARLQEAREVEYWSGTESGLRDSLFNMKPLGSVAVSTTAAATPVARPRTPVPARRDVAPAPQGLPASGVVALTWQGPRQAKPGETIRLTLNAQSAQAMNGTELLVSYDPDVFKAIDVVEGGFFRQNDTSSTFSKTIDQTSGQILVEASDTAPEGVSGTASIVTLVFEAAAARPQSQILVGRMTAVDPAGEELAVALPQPHLITVAP